MRVPGTIPAGLTSAGLPLAMQFIAGAYQETALLAAARWSEQALGLNLAALSLFVRAGRDLPLG